jgi:uncharacterized membrane protein
MQEDIALEDYKKSFKEIITKKEKRGFKIHLACYLITNTVFLIANLAFSPEKLWFLWPLLGWGIGIFSHYLKAVYFIERDMEKIAVAAENLVKSK